MQPSEPKIRGILQKIKRKLFYDSPLSDGALFDAGRRANTSRRFDDVSNGLRSVGFFVQDPDENSSHSNPIADVKADSGQCEGQPQSAVHPRPLASPRGHRNQHRGFSSPTTSDIGTHVFSTRRNFSGSHGSSALRSCNICAEERPERDFPTVPVTSDCVHAANFACNECVRRQITMQLSNHGDAPPTCVGCQRPLSDQDMQRNATREDFERYCERAAYKLLESDHRFIWCPLSGCGGGQIHEYGSEEPKVTCCRCGGAYCFIDKVRWHTGSTCREYSMNPELAEYVRSQEEAGPRGSRGAPAESLQDEATAQERRIKAAQEMREIEERRDADFVRSRAMPCPKCKYMTQKDGGCKHVTCKPTQYPSLPILLVWAWLTLDSRGDKVGNVACNIAGSAE
ncbi:hypothetical protein EPUS_07379 [Endocarpon pusillum Z07020]|uniref:RBR-type E3 ubiquitin transferase n=1 Tax=Endocarpon pusillum (strain Z07020 / HMAS-L-300199) TaxID=1263415 RepID=U1I2J7_ENDPU|nr:uncharacterized protein EPUS_07379 [Endocarpon pusillum Z07020]ERF76179.1 hypothetical protein EPUS_07379 [Endocarpon pusillum Z07020]